MEDHFKGKDAHQHLKEARLKGAVAAKENHAAEMSGPVAAAADAAKETSLLLIVFACLLQPCLTDPLRMVLVFLSVWLTWKMGRSALLGWSRLERLHRLIEEERYEIVHNREQEKEELREMYAAKGFSGKLLDQVVHTLMADDNRLLKVMLEEELGVVLESMEHPLKQACGAGMGVCIAGGASLIGWMLFDRIGLYCGGALILFMSAWMSAKVESNRPLHAILWTCAVAALSASLAYFIGPF
jgi:hypothetical protein